MALQGALFGPIRGTCGLPSFQIRTLVVWKWKGVLVAQNRQGDLLAQHGALLGVGYIGALLVS